MRKFFLAFSLATLLFAGGLVTSQPASAAPVVPGLSTTIGEAIVGFAPGFLPRGLQVGGLLGGLSVSRVSTNGSFLTVKAPRLDIVTQALARIPGVSYVEDNALMHANADLVPGDSQWNSQYGPQMMRFPTAWGQQGVGFGSSNVIVAIIDSGILKTHVDLTGPRILQGKDFVNNDMDPNDDCGHGTHTAGILGATTNNGTGIAGASQASIMELKGLAKTTSLFSTGCSGSIAGISDAIRYAADNGAKVISMSIGGGASTTLESAVNYAWGKGVILVAAAGNDGGTNSIDYPGAYTNVIAVGALDSNKARASYSDGGPQLDIMAPGSNVVSTYTGANNATYSTLSGTSMATPAVAGALALAIGCESPVLNNQQLVQKLYDTAEPLGAANLYGKGLARADKLVAAVCPTGPPPPNQPPVAAFSATPTGNYGVQLDASSSYDQDPNPDPLSYQWIFGDNGTVVGSTNKTVTHTYSGPGPWTITLKVSDGPGGHTTTTSTQFTATAAPPPPPPPADTTTVVTSGQTTTIALSASNADTYFKISVPAGKTQLKVVTTGPSCGFFGFSCPVDADLYVRRGLRPTDSLYDCRPFATGSNETCTMANPAADYWYLRVKRASGSGSVKLTATVTP